jgi:hypothetical protein
VLWWMLSSNKYHFDFWTSLKYEKKKKKKKKLSKATIATYCYDTELGTLQLFVHKWASFKWLDNPGPLTNI